MSKMLMNEYQFQMGLISMQKLCINKQIVSVTLVLIANCLIADTGV